ncbi:YciI family protein [Amycolatopsis magusensis]|uniref:YciI family protein n=1 Tax=Amycolatopsis magusensis TaxID=882444 RepID=UPI0024A9790B|nr:YciI family protein [Amycolatopsis magusensis]MDI5974585.1 YciI family protein [Amycolatopsis magusensis]
MILVYGSQQAYDELAGDTEAIDRFLAEFTGGLAETGELVDAQGLSAPASAREVRLRAGVPVITDGPYAETEEVLAGYWIIDCASLERATEIATALSRAPGPPSRLGTVIRPLA